MVPRAVPVQHVARGAEVVAEAVEAPPDGARDGLTSTGTALYVGMTDTWRGKERGGVKWRGGGEKWRGGGVKWRRGGKKWRGGGVKWRRGREKWRGGGGRWRGGRSGGEEG